MLSTAGANTVIDASNLFRIPEIVARFLSFASFELPRFLGNNTASRLEFLARQPWSIPFAVFAGVLGLLQPLVLLAGFVNVRIRKSDTDGRRAVAWLALLTIALICASFLFSLKDPASHAFYVAFPVANIYAFQVWERLLQRRWARSVAAALLVCTAVIHAAIALDHRPASRSIAIVRSSSGRSPKSYLLLGERRPVLWGREP